MPDDSCIVDYKYRTFFLHIRTPKMVVDLISNVDVTGPLLTNVTVSPRTPLPMQGFLADQ